MNVNDYSFMQSLNVAKQTPEQLEWLTHKLPNYTMVNYGPLREQIPHIDENYPFSMPCQLIFALMIPEILIIVLGFQFFYISSTNMPQTISKTSSIFWHKGNPKETEVMLLGSSHQSRTLPKVKVTHEKVREMLELLGMDFSDFDKDKNHKNSKDGGKVAITSV